MKYRRIFDPIPLRQDFRTESEKQSPSAGDRRDGKVYLYTEEIILAVNVAIATGRPLLVRGSSGCGKSSLAYNVARVLQCRYYEYVITSRTQARDLLWRFDAVRRLNDAQIPDKFKNIAHAWEINYPYIEPGILWWVFDQEDAKYRGQTKGNKEQIPLALDPVIFEPYSETNKDRQLPGTVILLDEIDKAEPDFPNNLLVPLGSLEFIVDDIQKRVVFQRSANNFLNPENLPLIIITTNEERKLPQAFLRRCVVLEIPAPDRERLVEIAVTTEGDKHTKLYEAVANAFEHVQQATTSRRPPQIYMNIAEYLDAVRACLQLQIEPGSSYLEDIIKMTSLKLANSR